MKKKSSSFFLYNLWGYGQKIYSWFTLPVGSTVFIHIGKCGGSTIRKAVINSKKDFFMVHIVKPVYRKDLKYIIVARGPIARLNSTFRWRYKLVVTDASQKDRFRGEYDILVKYGNLNNIAEALYYENGTPNTKVKIELLSIFHISQNIAFYLKDLLSKCHPDQIDAVLMQENLDDDILRVLIIKII